VKQGRSGQVQRGALQKLSRVTRKQTNGQKDGYQEGSWKDLTGGADQLNPRESERRRGLKKKTPKTAMTSGDPKGRYGKSLGVHIKKRGKKARRIARRIISAGRQGWKNGGRQTGSKPPQAGGIKKKFLKQKLSKIKKHRRDRKRRGGGERWSRGGSNIEGVLRKWEKIRRGQAKRFGPPGKGEETDENLANPARQQI